MTDLSTTSLDLPLSLPYPITITRILATSSTTVSRGTPLLEYAFTSDAARKALATGQKARDESGQLLREGDMIGVWESGAEGTVDHWESWIKVGERIEPKYAGRPVIWLEQPCTHPVQIHGLCGVCGKDLTTDDYLSRPTNDQAGPSKYPGSFEMSHDALGVTVSTNEAKRLEHESRDSLLRQKRLSLIVDLDQTIIHTTVDPTVGEWMTEVQEGDQANEDERPDEGASVNGVGTTTPPGSPGKILRKGKGKERNPNAEALKDVARFHLPDELPPGYRAQVPDRWYYTKPRPGVRKFLDRMHALYEMHVYTMGTRSYAEAICKVVDPDGKYFGDRIISRDENRSFNSKTLTRLFPTDQSMVVVIDDRADVWGDIPNLVKVVPYDFFIGIGDINSGFLPATPPPTATDATKVETEVNEDATALAQTKLLDAVSEERPLAKMQEKLEHEPTDDTGSPSANGSEAALLSTNGGKDDFAVSRSIPTQPLLNNNDVELIRLAKILNEIHHSFYRAYEYRVNKARDAPLPAGCDVEVIIPDIKSRVFQGCTLVFSGVIPLHQRPATSEIFAIAQNFGAAPMIDITPNMTHCVTATLGTEKVHRASKMNVFVVWVDWFYKSVALWERQDERDYLAHPREQSAEAGPSRNGSGPGTPKIVVEGEPVEGNGGDMKDEDMDDAERDWGNDDLADGKAWDEDADAELQAFLEGSSDYGGTDMDDMESRAGDESLRPPTPATVPGSPSRKRVRYADEESLPLESFRDPPEDLEPSDNPPRKRLLLEAPTSENDVPVENKFQWRGRLARQAEADATDQGKAPGSSTNGEEEGGDDDDFAQMLQDSLGN